MNTYIQDEIIPIFITLTYDGIYTMKLPINPEVLEKNIASESEKVNIEGLGEVGIPTSPKLATMTINSFFWQDANLLPSALYVAWIEKWQKSEKPATMIVTRLNYSMEVTCEGFRHWVKAGEEKDVYYELKLQEYKPYGAKKLGVVSNQSLLQSIKNLKELVVPPILFEIPRPVRSQTKKKIVFNPYTTKKNDTLSSIVKKITGSTSMWKELYDENKTILGDLMAEDEDIPIGTELMLPASWITNNLYNIQNVTNEGK